MQDHDSKFESYLREFRPRQPRALEQRPLAGLRWPRRLGAAAVIALGAGALLWLGSENREESAVRSFQAKPSQPTGQTDASELLLLPMTRLALDNPQQLDARLTKAARSVLPNFRKSDSTLRFLAKE